MKPDKKSPEEKPKERIDLNNYDRKEDEALRDHPDASIKTLDHTMDEQMGGTDSAVTSKPNYI